MGSKEVSTPYCGYPFAAASLPSLCNAAASKPYSQAHAHTTTSEPQLWSLAKKEVYRPLADPSQAQSAPAPRALAFCFCSSGLPAWRVVSLCPRTPGKSSKKTLLGPSWTTSGVKQGIHQSAHSASLQPQLLAKWSLLALHQRPVSRCVPKFPRSLPSLALASLSCAKAYTNYMPKNTPIFKRFPP